MSDTAVCPAAAANARIVIHTNAIFTHTAFINEEKAKMRSIDYCILKLTDMRVVHTENIAKCSASIAASKADIEEARAVVVASDLEATKIAEARRAAADFVDDAKWLESVFAAPPSAAMTVVHFDCYYRTGVRRLALFMADPRRVDKRHWVRISNLKGEFDLTPFANAGRVALIWCTDIVDVSALAGVKHVTLQYTPKVSDVSSLRSVRTLHLETLPLVGDASIVMLRGVHELLLDSLLLVTDAGIAALRGVHTLALHRMPKVTDAGIAALRGVEFLRLDNLLVTDISALECVPNLYVWNCTGVQRFQRGNTSYAFQFQFQ